MADHKPLSPKPSLDTLPSELRRLIVSHLAPHPDELGRGCKQDLKNANSAHSCLHEWATEYMFRDMALQHVLVGMSSQLELFGVTKGNERLTKLVKHIKVHVPPALRWEIGSDDPFGHHLEEITHSRLRKKFGVTNVRQMKDEQRQYASDYYRAMVEPFTDNRTWYRLLRSADASWAQVFALFDNLEEISVGSCEIVDHPASTYTHNFVLRHGEDVIEEPEPPFIQDCSVNLSWASSIVMKTAPSTVSCLRLDMANMDNFNSFATVNRLLTLSHRQQPRQGTSKAKRLCLTLKGINGTHGDKEYDKDTGSAGVVRHWESMLNSTVDLEHLELRDNMHGHGLQFSSTDLTDKYGSIIDWLLPDLKLPQLKTIRLVDFALDEHVVAKTFSGNWPSLEHVIFQDVALLKKLLETTTDTTSMDTLHHIQGMAWLDLCTALLEKHPGLRITLQRPRSSINMGVPHDMHATYIEKLKNLPGVVVDVSSRHYSGVPPKERVDGEEDPLFPEVPTTAIV